MAERITAIPSFGSVDGPLSIEFERATATEELVLTASVHEPNGRRWSSSLTEPADLIWSMTPDDGIEGGSCFDESSISPLLITIAAAAAGRTIASTTVERHFVRPGCRLIDPQAVGLAGMLFLPPGPGPFLATIVVGGSTGGLGFSAQCAAQLAGHGYASLALAYFAAPGLSPSLLNIRLEYFTRAIEWLLSRQDVLEHGVIVIGRSRGAELALLLGAKQSSVRGVIAYSPSDVVCGGVEGGRMVDAAAWSSDDQPIAWITPTLLPAQLGSIFGERPIRLRRVFELGNVDEARARTASIPVEKIAGPVLLFSGDDDQVWPSERMCDGIMTRLEVSRHPFAFAHHCYSGAGHLFRIPGLPTTIAASNPFAFGGEPRAQADANRSSWREVLKFLEDVKERASDRTL